MQQLGKNHVVSVKNRYHLDSLKGTEIDKHMTLLSKSKDKKGTLTTSDKVNNKM